jgi:hypothetical protein
MVMEKVNFGLTGKEEVGFGLTEMEQICHKNVKTLSKKLLKNCT